MSKTMRPLPTGRVIDLAKPDTFEVKVDELGYLLSRVKRFNGFGISVEAHSVAVAKTLLHYTGNPHIAMLGLLHDSAEAFVGDVATPVKYVVGTAWDNLEVKIHDTVVKQLHGLNEYNLATQPLVKLFDEQFLAYELRDLIAEGYYKLNEAWGSVLNRKELFLFVEQGEDLTVMYNYLKDRCEEFDKVAKEEVTYCTSQGTFKCIIDSKHKLMMEVLCQP